MTKQELRNFRDKMRKRQDVKNRQAEVRVEMEGLKAQAFNGTPGGGLATPDARIVACLVELEKLDKLYADFLIATTQKEIEIEKAMLAAKLTANETEVIRLYYFDVLKWEEVAEKMHYSFSLVTKAHGWALKKLSLVKIEKK